MIPVIPLKLTLLINAFSSLTTGALLIFLTGPIAKLFGVPQLTPFREAGLFLVLFSSLVFVASLRRPIHVKALRLIIALDALWVIASIVLLLVVGSAISTFGVIAILAVAGWVAMMVILQRKGLRSCL